MQPGKLCMLAVCSCAERGPDKGQSFAIANGCGWLPDKIKRFIPLVYVHLGPFPTDGCAQLLHETFQSNGARLFTFFFIICSHKSLGDFLLARRHRGWGSGTRLDGVHLITQRNVQKSALAVSFERD